MGRTYCHRCGNTYMAGRGCPCKGPRPYDQPGYRHARARVLARDHNTCHWCGGPADTVDHLTPAIDGGTNDQTNMVAACRSCNSSRGSRPISRHIQRHT